MAEIINFSEHLQLQKERALREKLIMEMNTNGDSDYTFLQLLDLYCQKHQPDIYWRFDLFINGKLD